MCGDGVGVDSDRVVSNELYDYSVFTFLHTLTWGDGDMSNHRGAYGDGTDETEQTLIFF